MELEDKLQGYNCSNCNGLWIKGYQYWKWLKTHENLITETSGEFTLDVPVSDSKQAKIYIECGRLMIRNKVGHGISFYLDRCSSCGGIWFEKNEWEMLKSRKLHDVIHLIFTSAWQRDSKDKERRVNYENGLVAILGHKDYDDLKRIKSLMDSHPRKDRILGYLLNG